MAATEPKSLKVKYSFVDGAHFFVSHDKDTIGLCAASADPKTAYLEVSKQLSAIFKHKTGKDWQFKPTVPVEVFVEWVEKAVYAAALAPKPIIATPSSIVPWMQQEAA
jgi:hypothetical protein